MLYICPYAYEQYLKASPQNCVRKVVPACRGTPVHSRVVFAPPHPSVHPAPLSPLWFFRAGVSSFEQSVRERRAQPEGPPETQCLVSTAFVFKLSVEIFALSADVACDQERVKIGNALKCVMPGLSPRRHIFSRLTVYIQICAGDKAHFEHVLPWCTLLATRSDVVSVPGAGGPRFS